MALETSTELAATTLPRFIVIRSYYATDKGYVYYKVNEGDVGTGSVILGEDEGVFSTLVKIEVERATSDKYVHLRFSHSNKYWAKSSDSRSIVAESNEPEEDTSKPSCTLFEISWVDNHGDGVLYFIHVQSGGRVRIDESKAVYVDEKSVAGEGYLTYLDWDSLVKLPDQGLLAFKGDNEKVLRAFFTFNPTLQFSSEDANEVHSSHQVVLMPDGHVRIKSLQYGMFWRRTEESTIAGNVVLADASGDDDGNINTLFWPVKIDENTIALRNKANNNFCCRANVFGIDDILDASVPTITKEARLVVQELVLGRKIYNVRYRMEDARIFNETPFLAGTTTVTNESDQEGSSSVAVTYTDEKSHSFSRSVAISAGITTTIETDLLEIVKASIQVSFSITGTFEWNDTTTTSTSVTATGAVPVPARTIATVSYVGTKGTCNVPFSYTQQDVSSTDGHVYENDQIDGIYTGVNCYNFNFVIEKTVPI